VRTFPLNHVNGDGDLAAGIGRNIARRTFVKAALRKSEEKWRSLTENSPDHIMPDTQPGQGTTFDLKNRPHFSVCPPGSDPPRIVNIGLLHDERVNECGPVIVYRVMLDRWNRLLMV
jgi:hypothetical protein